MAGPGTQPTPKNTNQDSRLPTTGILGPPVAAYTPARPVTDANFNEFARTWTGLGYGQAALDTTLRNSREREGIAVAGDYFIFKGQIYQVPPGTFQRHSSSILVTEANATHVLDVTGTGANRQHSITTTPRERTRIQNPPPEEGLRIPSVPRQPDRTADNSWSPVPPKDRPDLHGTRETPRLPQRAIELCTASTGRLQIRDSFGGGVTDVYDYTERKTYTGCLFSNVRGGTWISADNVHVFLDVDKGVPIGGGQQKYYFTHPTKNQRYSVTTTPIRGGYSYEMGADPANNDRR